VSGPRLYALPPGAPVAEGVARGFWRRNAGAPPEAIARTVVLLNTARALRETERALADLAPGPGLLPRARLIEEIGTDPLALPGVPPAVDPLRRHLGLLRLVEGYISADPDRAPPRAAAADLAESLAALIDRKSVV